MAKVALEKMVSHCFKMLIRRSATILNVVSLLRSKRFSKNLYHRPLLPAVAQRAAETQSSQRSTTGTGYKFRASYHHFPKSQAVSTTELKSKKREAFSAQDRSMQPLRRSQKCACEFKSDAFTSQTGYEKNAE